MKLELEEVASDGHFTRPCWVVVRFKDGRINVYTSQVGSPVPSYFAFFDNEREARTERDELCLVATMLDE